MTPSPKKDTPQPTLDGTEAVESTVAPAVSAEREADTIALDHVTGDLGTAPAPSPSELEVFRPDVGLVDPRIPQDLFAVIDSHDEALIMHEIQGTALDTMLYSFRSGGKTVTDLSYAGVAECVRRMNAMGQYRIKVDPHAVDEAEVEINGQPYIRVRVYAIDEATGFGQHGVSQQPKRMKLKPDTAKAYKARGVPVGDDDCIDDEYAYTKAWSKAQRNALKAHVPFNIREELKATLLGDTKAIKRIRSGIENLPEQPPALTDDEAKQLVEQARNVFTDIKAITTEAVTPGQFHRGLQAAQHDHQRLRDYIAALEQILKTERESVAQAK